MIRYRISREELRRLISQQDASWPKRAKDRTRTFHELGRYEEKSSIWSEVKPIYMRLQGESKCAYCERKLESQEYGKGEQAVEHFRPKGKVKPWRLPTSLKGVGISLGDVPTGNRGYFLLAYDFFNYAAACNPCNSALKGNFFPIAGKYDFGEPSASRLKHERAYLIYPIGSVDDDPKSILEFYGTSPRPVAASGQRRHRALVTIEFFRLDDPEKRKNLFRERAMILVALYGQLERMANAASNSEREAARKLVESLVGGRAPHANCAASFKRLYAKSRNEARNLCERAAEFIISVS
jgi:hypothetical protein